MRETRITTRLQRCLSASREDAKAAHSPWIALVACVNSGDMCVPWSRGDLGDDRGAIQKRTFTPVQTPRAPSGNPKLPRMLVR